MDILVIPTYQRPEYLKRTLAHVFYALDRNVIVQLTDDGSEPAVINECEEFIKMAHKKGVFTHLLMGEHAGVAANMLRGIEHALLLPGVQTIPSQLIITLDSDFIVKPNFFNKLRWLMQNHQDTIGTGFNAVSHPIIRQCDGYAIKRSIGGGNQAYTLATYQKYVRPALVNNMWDWNVCKMITNSGGQLLCVTPSVCQHIGTDSLLAHPRADIAVDYV